jgi:Lipopolysaccharide-assembly
LKKSCSHAATRDVDGERAPSLSLSIRRSAFRIPQWAASNGILPFSIFQLIALCAAALLSAGCAGYRLGPVNGETGDKSVQVLPFNNQTLQPRLGDAVTQATREQVQTDGTYHLANADGDIVVSGIITGYSRSGLSFLSSDVLTANNYQVAMTAHVIIRERATGKVLLNKDVKGYTLVHVGSDLASAERQAMPLLAEDFARKLTQMLTEGTW